LLNPYEHITIEELRQCPEFVLISEEMAQNMLSSICDFCNLIADHKISSEIQEGLSNIEQ
jgi:hypothetical protein